LTQFIPTSSLTDLNQHQQVVERLGIRLEQTGFRPIEGRIFALLLLSDPRHKSMDEIQTYLSASKSSVSTALKNLTRLHLIEPITFSGNRLRYYRINMTGYLNRSKRRMKGLDSMNELLNEVIELRAEEGDQDFITDLQEMLAFNLFISRSAKRILREWEENKDRIINNEGNHPLTFN